MPGETTEVHYHLSANVQFDKDNAFNGKTNPGGSSNNPNIEKFSVQITYSDDNQKFIINNSSNEAIDFQQLKNYKKIMINDKLYELEQVQNGNNLKILFNCDEEIDNNLQEYFFYGESKDNKGNTDKTFAGNTYNIFAKDQKVKDKQIQQFYHGGSGRKLNNETKKAYNQDLIKEKQSFTLFYTRENIRDLNNENSILIGLGEIQNKIGVLDTSDRIEGSKIYCYNHYKGNDENKEYYLFRFPYQELIHIAKSNNSAKQFLEELIEPLSIENSDKPFFSKEQSKLISTYIVLKYANRLYEQIMKLKQNENLWKAVQKASKQDPQTENSKAKWHFCDDVSIRFLKLSIEKLKQAQLKQKNPGLWALKDYFQINSGNEYENFLEMCSGKSNLDNDLRLFKHNSTTDMYNSIKNFINLLINYPIYNKKTIQRIFTHLGFECIFKVSNQDSIYTNLIELEVNGKTINDLIGIVNGNKKIENNENKICKDNINPEYLKTEINDYLYKNGICEVDFVVNDSSLEEINDQKFLVEIFQSSEKSILKLEDLKINPYLLFEKYIQNDDAPLLLDDIDWGQKIILKKEIEDVKKFNKENPFRLRAIVVEYIKKQENQSGHVWVSYEDAQEYLNDRLFELDGELAKFYSIEKLFEKGKIILDNFDDIFQIKDKFLTLKEFANRETYIKNAISGLIKSSHSKSNQKKVLEELKKVEQQNPDNKFIESEKSLIKMKELDFVFISGVAGSGKSHTLCKYLDYLAENEITDFQVLTPSGKAANVIKNKIKANQNTFNKIWNYLFEEDNDKKIKNKKETKNDKEIELISKISTADRYIVDSNKFWNHRLFARVDNYSNSNHKIEELIIDEISMITLDTLYYILKIKKPKKLIILGDIKQLPPIGYGSLATSIYNHLFLESSFQDICLAKMETSHRADDNSLFIKHSLTLRDKEKQLKKEDLLRYSNSLSTDKDKNFILLSYSDKYPTLENPNKLKYPTLKNFTIKNFTLENPNKLKDFTLEKQIISIYNIEGTNTTFSENIKEKNKDIQILTPNRIGESGTYAINEIFKNALGGREAKEGLKFIYNKNDKKTGLSNGTMGYYDEDKIDFDGVHVPYKANSENTNYELGFAITVHKSQGSGFPIVILVLPKQNNSLITKELIYTALTRPEKKMYILYHEDNIKALTQLPSIPHRNMNLFDRDKLLWIKDEIEYPIKYNDIVYRRKQDLYFALMLEYSDTKEVTYHKNGSFVWNIDDNEEILLMPKFYIKEKQDEKSFRYLKSIDLRKVYENFELNIACNSPEDRFNENKVDIIEDNNDSIEIITHNGLRTRSWSEAILMLIFDKLQIPYFYEVEIRREKHTNNEEINTYKLTYPNPEDSGNYRIPDFTIATGPQGNFGEDTVTISDIKCIIEHLGMLTNESYLSKWKEKVKDYYEKYKFDIVAPLSSLNFENGDYTIGKKWEIGKDEATNNEDGEKKLNICFTTDEKDLEDIPTLIKKLELLKEFYFPKQESK